MRMLGCVPGIFENREAENQGGQRSSSVSGEGRLTVGSQRLFYLGRRVVPSRSQWGCDCTGLAKKSWPQINSAIYGPSPSNCSSRDGKYCSLSRITGCCNAPKACFMAAHKCSRGEAARVGLISATEESRSVTHAPLGNAVMDASGRWREALNGRCVWGGRALCSASCHFQTQ